MLLDPFAHKNAHLAIKVLRVRGLESAKQRDGEPASLSATVKFGLTVLTLSLFIVWAIWGRG